jgi:hypothetical protein
VPEEVPQRRGAASAFQGGPKSASISAWRAARNATMRSREATASSKLP